MYRLYHNCHFCGGEVVEKKITIDYRWGKDFVAIVENVPTGVCQVCGEQYLKANTVKDVEKLVNSREEPKKVIEVPLRELAVVV
jgi:YgiT-type zinc finger domain-containing protein